MSVTSVASLVRGSRALDGVRLTSMSCSGAEETPLRPHVRLSGTTAHLRRPAAYIEQPSVGSVLDDGGLVVGQHEFGLLGEVPAVAFDDLDSIEPRLVATAAQVIARHGDAASKERLKRRFTGAPLWQTLQGSGIDDYNILRITKGE